MAANKERGELPLKVGTKTYVMRLTTNAVCEMQTVSGHSFDRSLQMIKDGDIVEIRLFLWAMLQGHHPELTVDEVGDIIDAAGGFLGVAEQLEKVIGVNVAEAPKSNGASRNPRKAQVGTGGKSISTPVGSV